MGMIGTARTTRTRTMRTRTAGLAEVVPEAIGMMDLGAGDLKGMIALRQVTERELIHV